MAQTMSDSDLLAITGNEIRQSQGYRTGKLSEMRRRALQYYLARPVGDLSPPEVEGRSTYVSTDVADTINWMLPVLLKTFTASGNVVEFEARKPQADQMAEDATAYVNWIFFTQNPGFQLLNTWFNDALLQKNGIIKAWWDVKKVEDKETYTGLNDIQLAQLLRQDGVEPMQHSERPQELAVQHKQDALQALQQQAQALAAQMQQASQAAVGNPQAQQALQALQQQAQALQQQTQQVQDAPLPMVHDVTIKRTSIQKKASIANVPPEEFLISREAKQQISDAKFCAHQVLRTYSDLTAMGYKNVENLVNDDTMAAFSPERIERQTYNDEQGWLVDTDGGSSLDKSMRRIWVTECYMRLDWDGDGIAEWRKITRAGNTILDNEECDGPPFCSITPLPLAHQFYGQSIADYAMEIQKHKTAMIRAMQDNFYLQVNGRTFAVEGQVNLDDLMTSRPGGVVRIKQPGAVGPLGQGVADMEDAQTLLSYMDQQKESRTGWTSYSQGTNADALNQTATGVDIITSRGDIRIELIARTFAETGITDLFQLLLKLVCTHQDEPAIFKLNDRWMEVDPREWKDQFNIKINVGLGTGNKDKLIQQLMALRQIQMQDVQIGAVTPANIYATDQKICEAMGFQNTSPFFTDPANAPQQPSKADPVMEKVQGENQREMLRLQWDRERDAAEQQRLVIKDQQEITFKYKELDANIAVEREANALKYKSEQEMALFDAQMRQTEALINGAGSATAAGNGPGFPGNGAAGQPALGAGLPNLPPAPDVSMGSQPGP